MVDAARFEIHNVQVGSKLNFTLIYFVLEAHPLKEGAPTNHSN